MAKSQFTAEEDAMMGALQDRRYAALRAEMERRGEITEGECAADGLTELHGHELHAEILRLMPANLVDIDHWSRSDQAREGPSLL